MDADRLKIETLKLLVQVAWADHEIAREEYDYLVTLAEQCGAADGVVDSIRRSLRDEGRLPAPDMAFLREYPDDVMRAIDVLVAIDDHIAPDETAIAQQIRELLGG